MIGVRKYVKINTCSPAHLLIIPIGQHLLANGILIMSALDVCKLSEFYVITQDLVKILTRQASRYSWFLGL